MKKASLQKAAGELNEKLGLEPAIDTDEDEDTLKAKIAEASAMVEEEDAISKSTMTVIEKVKAEAAQATEETSNEAGDDEEESEEGPEEEPKPTKKATKKAAKAEKKEAKATKKEAKKEAKTAPKAAEKKGVIATIVSLIEDAGKEGISKEDILKELVEEFPDKSENSMKATINVQVPSRITKERFAVENVDGKYRKVKVKK